MSELYREVYPSIYTPQVGAFVDLCSPQKDSEGHAWTVTRVHHEREGHEVFATLILERREPIKMVPRQAEP